MRKTRVVERSNGPTMLRYARQHQRSQSGTVQLLIYKRRRSD